MSREAQLWCLEGEVWGPVLRVGQSHKSRLPVGAVGDSSLIQQQGWSSAPLETPSKYP